MQIDALVRSKRKTIALIVQADGSLLVRAPLRATQAQIEAVIHDNLDWIHTKQEKARTSYRTLRPKAYQPGESFPYLGQGYPLHIVDGQRTALLFKDAFYLSHQALPRVKEVFTAWYKKQAAVLLNQRAAQLAQQHQLHYQRLRITSARTRWGSCSASGNLNFTWRLVMAPPAVIDYVVVHELAHLVVKNHSRAFWNKVQALMPDYKQQMSWLKQHGAQLKL